MRDSCFKRCSGSNHKILPKIVCFSEKLRLKEAAWYIGILPPRTCFGNAGLSARSPWMWFNEMQFFNQSKGFKHCY